METNALVVSDKERLEKIEMEIEHECRSFLRVGRLLHEIDAQGLYEVAGHKSLAKYCAARWNLGKTHAYRMIHAAKVHGYLSDMGYDRLPTTERVARALCHIKDMDLVEQVWAEATLIEDNPTGKTVDQIVSRVAPDSLKDAKVPSKKSKRVPTKTVDDELGQDGETKIKPDDPTLPRIDRVKLAAETIRAFADAWKQSLDEVMALDTSRPGFEILKTRVTIIRQEVENAISLLRTSAMRKVCPECNGDTCAMCERRGWHA